METGGLCVIISGELLMPMWPANNLDIPNLVSIEYYFMVLLTMHQSIYIIPNLLQMQLHTAMQPMDKTQTSS